MPTLIPPQPPGASGLPGSYWWNDFVEKVRFVINNLSTGNINHNDLQNIQGGSSTERYHLSAANAGLVPNAEQTTNKNANSGYAGLNSVGRITKGVDTTDDVIVDDATNGLVLKDTQGTPHYWRVTVDNTGALVTTDLGTTKP